ncbi:enoyl-CoA hydratase/isomerase family protein [Sandaracinobacter sp. RS1-74]|uniref:enoyl-CoA hydratase/isomerase family protein n=1 Tax=Sandaracinobacteroides sayramensis TaxID=2913411 RepID=UPI001EDADCFD|nr:enoyl-CoA hydratase/isomerase family protein [Sandaracinobacteroides sayramensis]MCG2841123.1 enoyl-CoA hydratase/isomerase family protein [Sandaracinobacteroides sayramensis]
MTERPPLIVEKREDGITVLTINRREARNTVSFEMWDLFSAALDELEGDTPARLLVITGAGGWFGNGGDVKNPPVRGDGALRLAARLEAGQRIVRRLRALPVPSVAAVEGGAYGISFALAMACDMIFAANDATFGAPFVDYGLVPDGGAAWFLNRRIGRARASEILYSGRSLDCGEALSLGLIARAVEPGTALEQAIHFGSTMGSGNRHAIELTRRLLDIAETSDLPAAHALELVYCHTCQAGDEPTRAREAFIARAAAARAAKQG